MRKIEIEEGLRVRFPGREAEFANGVEIGILLAHLGERRPVISQILSSGNGEQARVLAEKFGYRLVVEPVTHDAVKITMTAKGIRPRLRVVGSAC